MNRLDTPARVQLADTVVELEHLRSYPHRFVNLYRQAKSDTGYALCLCGSSPAKLVIRARDGRFHLARWPGGRHQHTLDCFFFRAAERLSGRSYYAAGAITETGDETRIRLAQQLRVTGAAAANRSRRRPTSASTAGSGGAVSLLGLTHWLWEQAGLNRWRGGWHRSWGTCHKRLKHEIGDVVVNKVPLETVLYCPPPRRFDKGTAAQALRSTDTREYHQFRRRLGRREDSTHAGLILGEITAIRPAKYGAAWRIKYLRDTIFATTALTSRLRTSFPGAFKACVSAENRAVGLLLVEVTKTGNLRLVDAGLMACTSFWIPVESSFEARMARALDAARRPFVKPLRFDARRSVVFPDFVLVDTNPHTVVEVWGVTGRDAYEQRKRVKRRLYEDAGTPLIEWTVHGPLPNLT